MNYLAHLHLAFRAKSSILGNMMADYVKGDPHSRYSDIIVDGIRMHRRIDVLTDTHPLVKEARLLFPEQYRRVAPITLDVFWDHFLSLNWSKFEPNIPLTDFVTKTRNIIEPDLWQTPEKFQELNEYLWSQSWLIRYADKAYIAQTLKAMARRRPRLSALEGSYITLETHYDELSHIFWHFYPELLNRAQHHQLHD
ncbi:ACP phosphodiesterase [Proteus myxofaciens]|uniref:Acyl carrier protein phosphodiesterase n=1 Tax=Proteus myxofaciens ATCC 19692 TaxID=1354337 RepID=A0A198FLR1_9GAMM|nr:ACP phosphodiesterase [Proteus myxofaciens]OAT25705.1 acyl carrier protein phosphodiesterase [Proteus myxofaciens ATCC 19692]